MSWGEEFVELTHEVKVVLRDCYVYKLKWVGLNWKPTNQLIWGSNY